MGSGWGSPLTIAQRQDSLIIEYTVFSTYDLQPPIRLSYALDGSASPNAVMIGHAEYVQRSRITWEGGGSTLVITTAHRLPTPDASGTVEVRQALTLRSPTLLLIETTRAAVPGTRGVATTTRTTYARS
jgi:hypothetical protein